MSPDTGALRQDSQHMRLVPPIVIDNHHPRETLHFFATLADLERQLEPWYVEDESFTAYDSEGRLLELVVERRSAPAWFGLSQRQTEVVTARPVETDPEHAAALRRALASFLEAQGVAEPATLGGDLGELVARAAHAAAK